MHEYESLEDQDIVGQGDVIEWVGADRRRPWQCFGVVVTADCDLAHEKHGGVISYVPAMLAEDFIWTRWRNDRFNLKFDELLNKAGTRIGRWRGKNGQSEVPLSPGAVRKWLERASPDVMLDEIGVTNKGERADFANILNPAKRLSEILACEEPDLERLEACYVIVNSKASENRALFVRDIQTDWSSLPGDLFHLPAMPGTEKVTGEGLFLHLRHIRQISADLVSARPDDFRTGIAKARRVARVSAPYRYAITQALARVFSDIGLPDAHDQRCQSAAHLFLHREMPA